MANPIRKQPRDFIWLDELKSADLDWPELYPGHKVWIHLHEYRATLNGEFSHLKLVISGGSDCFLIWNTTPDATHEMQKVLSSLEEPLSYKQLVASGFTESTHIDE